jgi:3-methyladenine DNA glycosylase/8-oxoguanine DNA glycosylase
LGHQAPYVLELVQNVASSNLDLESLKTLDIPTIELRKQLLAIKGVGIYAAANLLMQLGRYNFITVDSRRPIGKEETDQAFERLGE